MSKAKSPGAPTAGYFALLIGVCLAWMALSQVRFRPFTKDGGYLGPDGFLSFFENETIDMRFRLRGNIPSPLKLCYVDIDTESIANIGSFPWNREIFALVIDTLFTQGNVKAVGIDVVFSEEGISNMAGPEAEAGSAALGRSIQEHGNVVLAASYVAGRTFPFVFDGSYSPQTAQMPEMPGLPIVGPSWGRLGLIDLWGGDNGNRLMPLFARTEFQTYYPMALQLALIYWDLDVSALETTPNVMLVRQADQKTPWRIPLMERQLMEINWFSPWNSPQNHRKSLVEVLIQGRKARTGSAEEKKEAAEFFAPLRDAIVLIGPTDQFLNDVSSTPMDAKAVPRVSIHGNALQTLISGRFVHRPPIWLNCLLIALFGVGAASLSIRHARLPAWKKIAAALLILAYIPAAFLLFAWFDLLIPLIAPIGAALSCSFLSVLWQLGVEQGQRRRIKALFGSYVSPQIVDEMVEQNINPQVGGVEVEITALFSDIEAFSRLAEDLAPNELIELMSQYLTECTAAIIENKGTLDKYVGDAIIGIFGAPMTCENHAAAACRAAIGIQIAQSILCERWREEGARWPVMAHKMRTRVGLNTGLAVVGNVGSSLRYNYTMMGDNVNLAQRLEATSGVYGASVLVSATTYAEALQHDSELLFRHLDRILVPGRSKPVEIYELAGLKTGVGAALRECFANYEKGLACYFQRDWQAASAVFQLAAELEPRVGKRNPSVVMQKRCEAFLTSPPTDDWDLAFQLTKGA